MKEQFRIVSDRHILTYVIFLGSITGVATYCGLGTFTSFIEYMVYTIIIAACIWHHGHDCTDLALAAKKCKGPQDVQPFLEAAVKFSGVLDNNTGIVIKNVEVKDPEIEEDSPDEGL